MVKKEEWREGLRFFDLLNNHLNYLKVPMGNSYGHEMAKFNEAYKHNKLGHFWLSEGRLKGDKGRVDFVCLTCRVIKEFAHFESEQSLAAKRLVYPSWFTFEWDRV